MSFGNEFSAWLQANKANSLLAAWAFVIGLALFPLTRPYAIPLGILIMLTWFWKWKRKGGSL